MEIRRSLVVLATLAAAAPGCGGSEPRSHGPLSARPPASSVALLPGGPDAGAAEQERPLPYPKTRKVDPSEAEDVRFGVTVHDPYRWLEDGTTDEVRTWAREQDVFARGRLAQLPGRAALVARLSELSYVEARGTPVHRGSRYFYAHRDATKEKWVVRFRDSKLGKDNVLLDPNTWSADGSVALGGWWPSLDGKRVAYTTKKNNSDEATMSVIDVASGQKSEIDTIEGAKYGGASWTPSGDAFYYVWLPTDRGIKPADRPGYAEVRLHKLGQDPKKDAIIRAKTGDPKTFVNGFISHDGHFLFATVSYGWNKNDIYFQDLRRPGARAWQPLAVGRDAIFSVREHKDRFYVHTNDGAPKYRVLTVDPAKPERASWTEIVPERRDATLRDSTIVGNRLSLAYIKDVVTELELRELDGRPVRTVPLPEMGTASALVGDADRDEAYYSFASFTRPTEIHEMSVATGASSLWYRLDVRVDPAGFVSEQIFATSTDGTKIPIFVVHAADMKKDGTAKAILTGYGGFQVGQLPGFNALIYPWLERGGIYAFANLRGGNEYGEEWHRAGMRHKKQNVFDDFIASAEHLVREHYTRPEKLAIRGQSNGGLLVGAAITQRPELFRVALCGVPLLDMVRYHKFGSGSTWIAEYGSADESEEDFKTLFGYSPYHHVKHGARYPSTLILGADSDDRVDPMHARKFAAELQEQSAGGPVLLRIERNAGHGGADMVKATVEKLADEYSFAMSEMGP